MKINKIQVINKMMKDITGKEFNNEEEVKRFEQAIEKVRMSSTYGEMKGEDANS